MKKKKPLSTKYKRQIRRVAFKRRIKHLELFLSVHKPFEPNILPQINYLKGLVEKMK